MSVKEIAELARMCRKYGISHLEVGTTKLQIELAYQPAQPKLKVLATSIPGNSDTPALGEPLSDEDLLFWSAGLTPSE